jgi:hypothetical protein
MRGQSAAGTQIVDNRRWGVDVLAACGATLVAIFGLFYPMLRNPIPPLLDYAGHISRIEVLHELLHGIGFSGMYRLDLAVVPNLGVDAICLPLVELGLSAEAAGHVFLCLTFAALAAGIIALHYANFRRWSLWPVLAMPFLIQIGTIWGFLAYLLTLGLGFCLAAFWRLTVERDLWRAGVGLLIGSVFLFFFHLGAYFLVTGMIVVMEAGDLAWQFYRDRRTNRCSLQRLATCVVASALPLLLLAFAPMVQGGSRPPLASFLQRLSWAGFKTRAESLFSFPSAYDHRLDLASLAVVLALVLVAAATRRLRIKDAMVLPAVGLCLVYLFIPDGWYGTASLPDRLPIVLFMMAVAGTDLRLEAAWSRATFACFIAVLAFLRGMATEKAWANADAAVMPLLATLDSLPEGSRIYSAFAYKGEFISDPGVIYYGMPCYMAMHRHGFYPHVFAIPGQNIVLVTGIYSTAPPLPRNYRVDKPSPITPDNDPYSAARLAFYDYALVIRPEGYPVHPPAFLKRISGNQEYALYQINKPKSLR